MLSKISINQTAKTTARPPSMANAVSTDLTLPPSWCPQELVYLHLGMFKLTATIIIIIIIIPRVHPIHERDRGQVCLSQKQSQVPKTAAKEQVFFLLPTNTVCFFSPESACQSQIISHVFIWITKPAPTFTN